jgi:hypothetical protein
VFFQAIEAIKYKSVGAEAIAHGSTGEAKSVLI